MHSRREDAFKEGLGGIQEELMRTNKKSRIVLYYIDTTHRKLNSFSNSKTKLALFVEAFLSFLTNAIAENHFYDIGIKVYFITILFTLSFFGFERKFNILFRHFINFQTFFQWRGISQNALILWVCTNAK